MKNVFRKSAEKIFFGNFLKSQKFQKKIIENQYTIFEKKIRKIENFDFFPFFFPKIVYWFSMKFFENFRFFSKNFFDKKNNIFDDFLS